METALRGFASFVFCIFGLMAFRCANGPAWPGIMTALLVWAGVWADPMDGVFSFFLTNFYLLESVPAML